VPEAVVAVARRGRKRPRVPFARPLKWGSRCEPRLPPASFASGGPSCLMSAPQVLGLVEEEREKRRFAWTSTSRKARYESDPRARGRKDLRVDSGSQRWESAMARVLELEGFGVQKSIGRIATATSAGASKRRRKRAD